MSRTGTFFINEDVLESYRGSDPIVGVPAGIREIGEGAFMHCRNLKLINLPNSLRRIGEFAFCDCRSLIAVIVPEKVTAIGEKAFSNCTELLSVVLPGSLKRIGPGAFSDCVRLERLTLPEGLEYLGDEALRGCAALADGDGMVIARDILFSYVGKRTEVSVPEGVTEIGSGAFAFNESLTEAALPDSLRRIGVRAFMNCSGLRRVSLPKGLLRIGSGAFRDCGALTGLPLPEEPVKLGDDVFSGCRGLADKNGFLIHRGVLYGYFGPRREVSVPEGVKRIAGYAFGKWEGVLRLRLPDSLERIPPNAFSEGGDLVLVVRRWTRELSDAAAGCRIRALWTEDPSLVPRGLQRAARLGIAFAPEALPDTEETREAEDWFSRNAASLCRDAFELPELLQFLCRRRLLRPGDLDGYLEAARECDSPEITALLLNYMNVLGADTVYRVRERKQTRQEAAEEARARRLGARKPEDGIAGLRFAAEGTLRSWMTRRDLQTWLEARGAKLGTAVTARTDWLITDDPEADSDRLKKAEALGVPLISGTELLAMAGETGRRG